MILISSNIRVKRYNRGVKQDPTQLLKILLETDIPFQFVSLLGLPAIQSLAHTLDLPKPTIVAGNIIIGDVSTCDVLLTSHLDELSFGFKYLAPGGGWLAPYHLYTPAKTKSELTIIGIRDQTVKTVGKGMLLDKEGNPFCETSVHIEVGDRVVYHCPTIISENIISGKAIDDRVGVLISLFSLKELLNKGFNVALVLTDGEEHIPSGYFSRYFPHVLAYLKKNCEICFIDGIYKEGLFTAGITELPDYAITFPHSSYGKGYIVPPKTWGWLRDEIVPEAQKMGIKVQICPVYYSRGDDWGLVTNPLTPNNIEGFFVSYGAWGDRGYEPPLSFDINSINNCVHFATFVIEKRILKENK